ncbi:PREDICTED: RISC-loading complex subunit tarbp2 isoform X5 [Dinoponera quadriceps]|uniref:RISC-loading complex subunit tarbp2 isoform X5 n=1 Tax=Dinoponera quadriceps TaxID=609295 RepID=A0A6P3Y2P4_DINQU|nr:PREDICTED: RISC-loading complex subunit tarbp2 isoform X5 [Dinoponera quadriceps]
MEEMHQAAQVGPNMIPGVGGVSNHTNNVNRRSRMRVSIHAMMLEKLPLHEAARMEMKAIPSKTPVSVLQELLSRRGTIPKYELVQIEGAIHEPTFRYRVTVADVVAMGTGRSKKEAKHAAAKAVLDKLIGVNTESSESPLPNNLPDSQNLQELQTYGEEKVVNNPIGALQEMCMSRHWPPPKYTMEGEEGLPHERQFTIVCSILKYREVGQGKSKKVAKRHAAHKMWQALHDMNNQAPTVDEDENTCFNDGDVNLVQFLQEIASEQQFEVTYVDIEEKSISGKFQCLVQLSTLPVAVCYGCGGTSKDAQASAAQNALEYLKIMTKK